MRGRQEEWEDENLRTYTHSVYACNKYISVAKVYAIMYVFMRPCNCDHCTPVILELSHVNVC